MNFSINFTLEFRYFTICEPGSYRGPIRHSSYLTIFIRVKLHNTCILTLLSVLCSWRPKKNDVRHKWLYKTSDITRLYSQKLDFLMWKFYFNGQITKFFINKTVAVSKSECFFDFSIEMKANCFVRLRSFITKTSFVIVIIGNS